MSTSAERAPARPVSRWAFLRRPGWIAAILGALVFGAACFFVLAPWQFGRHAERQAANRQVLAATQAAALPLTDQLPLAGVPAGDQVYREVTATGTFLADAQVYVRVQQDSLGQPASEVVVPFRLDDGSLVMIDRGYVLVDDLSAGRLPAAPPAGSVTVTGRIQTDRPDPSGRAPVRTDGRQEVYGLSGAQIQAVTGVSGSLRQGHLELIDGSPGVLEPIGVPAVDSGPFLSYAWQWEAFGAMAVLGIGFFVYREITDPLGGRGGEDREPERGKSRAGDFDKSQLYDQE